MLGGFVAKRAALIAAVFVLAFLVVYGFLIFKSAIFSERATAGDASGSGASQVPPSLTHEEEARLIESTTAADKGALTQKEEKALIDNTSAQSGATSR
jgi:hypothetical protein